MSEATPALQSSINYRYQMHEIGLFTEIYLPKKAIYQEVLYQTLTDGFEFDKKIKPHFKKFEKEIVDFLECYSWLKEYPVGKAQERFSQTKQLYWGYSMYEVDGVFFSKERKRIEEERTQIIRITFLLDTLKEWRKDIKENIKIEIDLKDMRSYVSDYIQGDKTREVSMERSAEKLGEEWRIVLKNLKQWKLDVGIFLYGYILFEICRRIQKLRDKAVRKQKLRDKAVRNKTKEKHDNPAILLEDEIWVTSFTNIRVNKMLVPPKENTPQ